MTELGNRLKEKRIESKLSLDELQTITKIQKRYLQALEEGNYDILPGKFYARAFIKQYAEAVGLEPEIVFDEFKEDIPQTTNDSIPSNLSRVQSKQSSVSTLSAKILSVLPKLLVVLFVIGAAVAIWLLSQNGNDNLTEANQGEGTAPVESEVTDDPELKGDVPSSDEKDQVNANNDEDVSANNNEKEQLNEPTKPVQKLELIEVTDGKTPYSTYRLKGTDTFKANISVAKDARSYIGIKNGIGKSFMQKELADGKSVDFDFSNESEIEFNIGNTTATVLTVNGEKIPFSLDTPHQRIKIIVSNE